MVRSHVLGVLALALFPGCDEGGAALSHSVLAVCLRVEQPTERVFRTAEEWLAFATPVARGPVPTPDFGQVMVAAHFDGTGSACVGFTVDSVEATGDEVIVEATRHTSPDPCIAVIAYPQRRNILHLNTTSVSR